MCQINFYCSCRAACGRLALLNCVSANADTPDKTSSHTHFSNLSILSLFIHSIHLSSGPLLFYLHSLICSYLLFAAYLHTGLPNTSIGCAQSPLYSTHTHILYCTRAVHTTAFGLPISHTHTLYLLSLTRTLYCTHYTQQHCFAIFQALCQSS